MRENVISEFSEKLKNYIEESGYKIYSLSKESGLDKTTLQRMVGGERLPSLEFVKKLCLYLKLTKLQEEELLQLFQVQKLGKDLFDTRMKIHSLLYDIQQIRENLYNETVPMTSGSVLHEEAEKVRHLSYDIDIQRVIMFIIEEELREQEKPEIFMDVFDNCRYAMRQMLHAERTGKKNIVSTSL